MICITLKMRSLSMVGTTALGGKVDAAGNLIVRGNRIHTADPANGWVEAFAVIDGKIGAVGTAEEVISAVSSSTSILDVGDLMVLPGLVDVHAHMGLGGRQLAFELPLLPSDSVDEILVKVRDWAAELTPEEWIVGGIVGSTVLEKVTCEDLAALDAAAGGRAVLLRDDTMHNRWVNSRALELMGVRSDTDDPPGGKYVRDHQRGLTGVIHEMASALAEAAAAESFADPEARHLLAFTRAIETLNAFGITGVQESATMGYALEALSRLDSMGRLTAHVVACMPSRPFIEPGTTGEDLYRTATSQRSKHLHPTFAKYVLDGVPMTRTAAMLRPYLCTHGSPEHDSGEPLWQLEELVQSLGSLIESGLHAKIHATGDAAIRLALDAAEILRSTHGPDPIIQIAHASYISEDDIHRFAKLDVVPDCSPYLWFPSEMTASNAHHVPADVHQQASPLRELMLDGALVSAGSDWPCAAPTPDPWTGLATLVTRRNPDPSVPGELNPGQALSMEQAVAAFTRNPAAAMGLASTTGMIRTGLSADFIVLDRDIFTVSPSVVHETKVHRTYFEGRCVHDDGTHLGPDTRTTPGTHA